MLNEYFTSVPTILNNENSSNDYDVNITNLNQFINDKIPSDVYFNIPLVTPEQVQSYIQALDPTKATGLDGLGLKKKLAINSQSPIIEILINKSIRTGKFHNEMKCAKVFPIFKGGNKSDPSNYRPISILSNISKIFERHVNKHLVNYLTKYKLIHEHQSGFQKKKNSCQTALVKLIDQWMSCIDKGDFVGTLFLDLRKAFDVVDHTILIEKLTAYKFCNSSLQWFKSYLNG